MLNLSKIKKTRNNLIRKELFGYLQSKSIKSVGNNNGGHNWVGNDNCCYFYSNINVLIYKYNIAFDDFELSDDELLYFCSEYLITNFGFSRDTSFRISNIPDINYVLTNANVTYRIYNSNGVEILPR